MGETDDAALAARSGSFAIGGDLEVNRLGFGAMQLTGRGVWGEPEDPEECRRVLRRAVELGVNLIDTADSYGPEVSERLIGEALHPYQDDLVVATKGGLTRPGGRWVPDGHPEHLREACEGSLRRLKVERIDLYQLHTPDPKIAFEDSVWALALLREEGKIRHVGLSNVGIVGLRKIDATGFLLGGFEVCGDQVGVELLALRLEVDPVFHEEFGPVDARGVPVDENGFVWVPQHPVGQHLVV